MGFRAVQGLGPDLRWGCLPVHRGFDDGARSHNRSYTAAFIIRLDFGV